MTMMMRNKEIGLTVGYDKDYTLATRPMSPQLLTTETTFDNDADSLCTICQMDIKNDAHVSQ